MADYNNIIGSTGDVAQILENSSTELVTFLPRAVEIAEQRIANELPALAFNTSATGTLTALSNTIARPTDITTLRYLNISGVPLEFVDYPRLKEIYPSSATTGAPKLYAIDDPTLFTIGPAAVSSVTWVLGYRKPLAALSVGSPSNWLTLNAYSLLLTATVCEAVRFIMDDRQNGLMAMYEGKYAELLSYYIDRENRNQRDDFRPRPMNQRTDAGQQTNTEPGA